VFNAVINKVYDMNVLTDFLKLYDLAGAIIGSIDTDLGNNLAGAAGFVYSLKDFDTANMTMVMIPVGSAGNGANVVLKEDEAEPYWEALREDKPLPTPASATTSPTSTGTATAGATPSPPPANSEYAQPFTGAERGQPVVVQRPSDC
jgi:hypothetical protein